MQHTSTRTLVSANVIQFVIVNIPNLSGMITHIAAVGVNKSNARIILSLILTLVVVSVL